LTLRLCKDQGARTLGDPRANRFSELRGSALNAPPDQWGAPAAAGSEPDPRPFRVPLRFMTAIPETWAGRSPSAAGRWGARSIGQARKPARDERAKPRLRLLTYRDRFPADWLSQSEGSMTVHHALGGSRGCAATTLWCCGGVQRQRYEIRWTVMDVPTASSCSSSPGGCTPHVPVSASRSARLFDGEMIQDHVEPASQCQITDCSRVA
jgi:hypothetical protein